MLTIFMQSVEVRKPELDLSVEKLNQSVEELDAIKMMSIATAVST